MMEMNAMSNISDEILKAIKYAVDRKTVNCDKTYKSVKCCIPMLELKIGQCVWIKEPMGKLSGIHICGIA